MAYNDLSMLIFGPIFYGFKLFAIISLVVEAYLLYGQGYQDKARALVNGARQLKEFIQPLPLKEVKLFKEEKDWASKNKVCANLYWSHGFSGYCSLNGTFTKSCRAAEAYNLDKEAPRFYNRWREGVYITYSRYTDEELIRKTDKRCPDGWKDCSHNYCVKQYDNCPIIDLKLVKKADPVLNHTKEQQAVGENRVLAIFRSHGGTSKPFLNNVGVTLNHLSCLGRNVNGSRKDTGATLDLTPKSEGKCDESHPELLKNYVVVDKWNRQKFNKVNQGVKFAEGLPTEEASKYKSEKAFLSASIYSLKNNSANCNGADINGVVDASDTLWNNQDMLKLGFFIKAGVTLIALPFNEFHLIALASSVGIWYNMHLISERTVVNYLKTFFTVYVNENRCFTNLEHFKKASEVLVAPAHELIDSGKFRLGQIIYIVFAVICSLFIFTIWTNKPRPVKNTVPKRDTGASADSNEDRKAPEESQRTESVGKSGKEIKKVKRD